MGNCQCGDKNSKHTETGNLSDSNEPLHEIDSYFDGMVSTITALLHVSLSESTCAWIN